MDFVDDLRSNDLRITDLHRVFGGCRVVRLRGQGILANAVVGLGVPVVLVARAQSVVLGERVVQTRADVGAVVRRGNGFEGLNRLEVLIESFRIDGGNVVNVSALDADKKRGVLAERTADAA